MTQLQHSELYLFKLDGRPLIVQRAYDSEWTAGYVEISDPDTRAPIARCTLAPDGSRTFDTFGQPVTEDVLSWLLERMECTFDPSYGAGRVALERLAGSLSPELEGVHISLVKRCPPFEGLGAVEAG